MRSPGSRPAPSQGEGKGAATSFHVDGWLVEPSGNRLVKDATVVRVRPQLIDVLVCLAATPGQVVSKSRLVSEVWAGRYIVDTGVARCVAELRRALSDDARRPRIIETIPKRGYRLIAPVEAVEAARAVAGSAPGNGPAEPPAPAPAAPAPAAPTRWQVEIWSAARAFLAAAVTLTEIARDLARKVVG